MKRGRENEIGERGTCAQMERENVGTAGPLDYVIRCARYEREKETRIRHGTKRLDVRVDDVKRRRVGAALGRHPRNLGERAHVEAPEIGVTSRSKGGSA